MNVYCILLCGLLYDSPYLYLYVYVMHILDNFTSKIMKRKDKLSSQQQVVSDGMYVESPSGYQKPKTAVQYSNLYFKKGYSELFERTMYLH